jgi:hypothetical protein
MATLAGAVFLLGGIAVEPRLRSVQQSWVKTQTWLAGLDDGGVYGRRVLLGGVIFGVLGATLSGALATGWVDVFGFRRCASCRWLASGGLSPPRSLKGLAVPFGSDFLSGDVDLGGRSARRCCRAGVIWRRSRPSRARSCGLCVVLPVSPKNCVVLVFLVWFSYKLDTSCGCCVCIDFWPVFHINWSFLFFFMKRQCSCRLLQKKYLQSNGQK